MRELVVLGTASQVPTRYRNHNGYVLRWDDEAILFDPGEGTQRQMQHAGVSVSGLTRICVTHFHGDHCLGLPGVLQRMALDRVAHDVVCHYPAGGQEYFGHLRHAAYFHDVATVTERAVAGDPDVLAETDAWRLVARPLSHRVPTVGYQLAEPDGRRMRPDRLAALGISGPDVGRLARDGGLDVAGRRGTGTRSRSAATTISPPNTAPASSANRRGSWWVYRWEKWLSTSVRTPHSAAIWPACRAVRCP